MLVSDMWSGNIRLLQSSHRLLKCLKSAGLRMFRVQKDLLYKTVGGQVDEIKSALGMAHGLHLMLSQVSITYEDENRMKRMVALSLTFQTFSDDLLIMDYCDHCDMLPLKIMEGLAGKALENYEPHSCRNIYKMSNFGQPATITKGRFSCLVICLKSIPTRDHVDFVFKFLWPRELCYRTTIKRLILYLKGRLPNFKFACGAQLGDELRVIDIGKFSESGIQTILELFKVKNKLSPIPKVLEEGSKRTEGKGKTHEISLTQHEIEQQYGRTMEEAARNLKVSKSTLKRKWKVLDIGSWPGPQGGKRKVNNLHKDQSDMNEGDNRVILAPMAVTVDTMTIKVMYGIHMIKLCLPPTLITFEAVEKQIGDKLKLNAGSFKLEYCDEDGDWILLVCDEDMRGCIKSLTSLNATTIRLRVT